MKNPIYSEHSKNAIVLLGKLTRVARKERKLTAQEVADRAGISRNFLQRIEKGDAKCNIGVFFEVAAIVGVNLFDVDEIGLKKNIRQAEDKLTLLPKAIHKKNRKVDDDF